MPGNAKRIGLIGDVHAEHERLEIALDGLQAMDADTILCTGDVVDGRGCPDISVRLLRDAGVTTVRGNHDRWLLQDKVRHIPQAHFSDQLNTETVEYLNNLPIQAEIDTIDGKLLLCHGVAHEDLRKVWPGTDRMPAERSSVLDEIISEGNLRYMINGHMHFRTIIHFESLTLINAGTLKGEHWPGYSLLDLEAQEITAYEFQDDTSTEVKKQALQEPHHTVWPDTQAFSGGWDPVRLF